MAVREENTFEPMISAREDSVLHPLCEKKKTKHLSAITEAKYPQAIIEAKHPQAIIEAKHHPAITDTKHPQVKTQVMYPSAITDTKHLQAITDTKHPQVKTQVMYPSAITDTKHLQAITDTKHPQVKTQVMYPSAITDTKHLQAITDTKHPQVKTQEMTIGVQNLVKMTTAPSNMPPLVVGNLIREYLSAKWKWIRHEYVINFVLKVSLTYLVTNSRKAFNMLCKRYEGKYKKKKLRI
ncbi:hypothetical protein Btru_021375 [Bulinus truncatus]|nr:hypothetical protein Btru_021375 [Bulinus truncatus]